MRTVPETTRENNFDKELASHRDDLLRYALRLTGNPADANDLRQDVMLRAFEKRAQFTIGTSMIGWLRQIMFNLFVNIYRRKERERKFTERFATNPKLHLGGRILGEESFRMSNFNGADIAMDDRIFVADDAEHALRSLSYEFRIAIELVDIKGFSYAEAAAAMDVPVGTVMSRIYRARRKLQEALGEYAKEVGLNKKVA